MREVARDLGVSDVGLSKICVRHQVPKPPQGHWTKVHLGQAVATIALPSITDLSLEAITLTPVAANLPQAARDEIAQLTEERRSIDTPTEVVLETPTPQLHAALRTSAAKLRSAEPNRDGAVFANDPGMCGLNVGFCDVERIIAVLNAILSGLAARGVDVQSDGAAMRACRDPIAVKFQLKAKLEWRDYVPTERERAEEQKRVKSNTRERLFGANDFDLRGRAYPERHQVHSGEYGIAIESWASGARKSWTDGKTQRLECMIDAIIIGFDAVLVAEAARLEENAARDRAWRAEEERRARAQRRAAREEKRVDFAKRVTTFAKEAKRLEAWLSAAAPDDDAAPEAYRRFVAWVRERRDLAAYQSHPDAIARMLNRNGLFPEPDDLAEEEDEEEDE